MSIYVSAIGHYADPEPESYTLEHIIDTIRSDCHKDLVLAIPTADTKEEVIDLKKGLSQFFPTLQMFDRNRLADDSILTGIVQFDIDVQDNTRTDFDQLKQQVMTIPEVVYAFKSPSGGLKFGVLTDFEKGDDSLQVLKARYKQAYTLAKQHVGQFVTVEHDENMEKVKFPCYLSWDEAAFYNPDAKVLTVNDQCVYEPPAYSESVQDVSHEQIEALLQYIPTGLPYDERLTINFAVLGTMGAAGISLLYNHWTTDNRDKLARDLESQGASIEYGNVGHLINVAKQHGYKPATGRARRKLKATPTDFEFDPLLSVDEGMTLLNQKVQHFFDTGADTFLNISTGAGKTEAMLSFLRNPPEGKRILMLVPTHALAEEIKQRIGKRVNHIKGKEALCEATGLLKTYQDAGVAMPAKQCMQDNCLYAGSCRYIRQFDDFHARVRIMTHDEFVNAPPAWLYGSKGDMPRKGGWKPHYIIIDENWMDKTDHWDTMESDYPSIRNIINDLLNEHSLIESVERHHRQILKDHITMRKAGIPIPFRSSAQYINDVQKDKRLPHSAVLNRLHDYVIHRDDTLLSPIRLIGKRLCYSELNSVAKRYRDVPTLYLDATADERVVKTLLPHVNYHGIKIKPNDGIKLYQAENFNVSKGWLQDKDHFQQLVTAIQTLIAPYDKVGLITYKTIKDVSDDFDCWLADQCGIQIKGHFGDLRGMDNFKDVDCLLIVGRHLIPEGELESYAAALFGECDMDADFVDVPVRMKDKPAMAVNSRRYLDDRVNSVKNHFNDSETKQAIGRGRLIHGCAKDVYFFSNESMGADIEVTDFFTIDQVIEPEPVTALKAIGYCQNKPASLKQLGLTDNRIKKNRDSIDQMITDAGIEKITLTVVGANRVKRQREYFVYDKIKLQQHLMDTGFRIIE